MNCASIKGAIWSERLINYELQVIQHIKSNNYHHFMLLKVTVLNWAGTEYCNTYVGYAEKFLSILLKNCQNLWRNSYVSTLCTPYIYIYDDKGIYDLIDKFSSFLFLNAFTCRRIKRLMRSSILLLLQIINRLRNRTQYPMH